MASNDYFNSAAGKTRQMGRANAGGAAAAGTGSAIVPSPGGAAVPAPVHSATVRPTMQGVRSGSGAYAETLLLGNTALQQLHESLRLMDVFVNQRYMNQLGDTGEVQPLQPGIGRTKIRIFELTRLMVNERESFYEKLVSVYSAMNSRGGMLSMIIRSDGTTTRIYLCTSAGDTGASLIAANMKGHFFGSDFRQLPAGEASALLDSVGYCPAGGEKVVRSVSMLPGQREEEKRNTSFQFSAQGFEKFIDAMSGSRYTVVILAQAMPPDVIDGVKSGYEALYTLLSSFAKENVSYSENGSDTRNFGLSENFNRSITESISSTFGTSHTSNVSRGTSNHHGSSTSLFGVGFNSGSGKNIAYSEGDTTSSGGSTNNGVTVAEGSGTNEGFSNTTGWARTVNLTRDIKTVQSCMELVDESLKRINYSRSFGMWSCGCYVITDDVSTAMVASSTLVSLIGGDTQNSSHVYQNQWEWSNAAKRASTTNLLTSLSNLRHPEILITPTMGGVPLKIPAQVVTPGLTVSGRELPAIMRLPQRSVSGMVVETMAEFGRNFPREWINGVRFPISFGNIIHMNQMENTPVTIDLETMASHMFITGAPGSGKSNTTYNLLDKLIDKGIPFLVIEPVKGEYKMEFGGVPGIRIFTAKPNSFRQLRMNPFEFNPKVHIREHLSRILSVVSACWPLYGPMPAMLKEAFEEAYVSCGWDLELSIQVNKTGRQFPTFADVLPEIERIINESAYSADGKGDFKGALVTRIKMLMNGFEGQIIGSRTGISEEELFNGRTIVDLSNIGSSESRSLIMGMLIIKLREYRMVQHEREMRLPKDEKACRLKHVTILEEAHAIFPRCSQEVSQDSGNVQGASVGLLVDCVAELRSSGEGFMIIDQSPGKVDEAAIKNTAIKIVMRLSEKDDCEAMANALALNEDQMRTLSRLNIGVAAMFHVGWQETVLAKMGSVWDSKKYRNVVREADRMEIVKARSALVQWIFDLYQSGNFEDMKTHVVRAYIARLSAVLKTLTDDDWKDIEQRLNGFFIEMRAINDSEERDKNQQLERAVSWFIYEFLQTEGLFRAVKVPIPKKGVTDKLTDKEEIGVAKWYTRLVKASALYMFMPAKAHDTVWSPGNAQGAEHFKRIMGLIVYGEWQRRESVDPLDFRMSFIYSHLKKMKQFT